MEKNIIDISDWVADRFIENGIDRVFVYPGGTIAPLVNACIRRNIIIENFKNEQGAGYAALAFSRLTGKPQVVMVTSGPGVTNVLTPLADAYYDSTPLIVITGQVGTPDLNSRHGVRQRGFQEVPTVSITSPISKLSICLKSSEEVYQNIPHAFELSTEGRQGPVVLDFPMDIQRLEINDSKKMSIDIEKSNISINKPDGFNIKDDTVEDIADAAINAKLPVLLLGQGALSAGLFEEYIEIANKLDAAVVTSFLGVGSFDTSNERYIGYIGHTGHKIANKIVHESDFLLVLGSRLDIRQTGNQISDFVPNGKVAWIDIDNNELENPRVNIDWSINACISEFCEAFIPKLPNRDGKLKNHKVLEYVLESQKRYEDIPTTNSTFIQPRELMDCLNPFVKNSKSIIVTGVGCHQHWAARHLSFKPNYIKHLSSGGHGAMGYDIPSAVGAAMAYPNDTVLCIVGDGSILMNIQELATIKERNLNIKIVVLNNRRLGMVSQFQLITWGADPTTGDIEGLDFKSIANGFGINSMTASKAESMESRINELFSISGPALLEVILDYDADVVPMLLAGQKMNEMWDGRDK
ncbi:MAG: thiamine pyrophosphate-binding protein [Candidatus Neomarinimicrobiota bacterium]